MPIARVTNLTSEPLLLRTLYGSIEPGAYIDVFRSAADLTNWRDLHEAVAAGQATLTITPTAAELGSAFIPYPGVTSGGSLVPIDTLANLALLLATGYPDGMKIYVNEVEDTYVLERAGSHVADGLCVIAAVGGGYWVARSVGRWDDVQGSIGQGAGVAALTVEAYRDTPFLMWFMRHDQNDALNFVYQLPHRWKYDTAVIPHLHVQPMSNPVATQIVRVDGYYAWSRPNYAAVPLPALSGWTTFGPIDTPIAPGDAFVQKIISLGSVTPPNWARGSTCLLIWFRRFGTDPGDTYTTNKTPGTGAANIGLVSSDVHFRVGNAAGTETEIPP